MARLGLRRSRTYRSTEPAAYAVLAALVAAGVALRVLLVADYRPAALANADSARYIHFALEPPGILNDPFGPTGYSFFLRVAHWISPHIGFTIAVQHLLGIAAALLLYGAVRRLGAPLWPALIAPAVVLLSGDQAYVEHTILTEAAFIPLLCGGLYCTARATTSARRRDWWLAGGGALLASAALVRTVGLVLLPIVIVWLLLAARARWPLRLRAALPALAAMAVVIGGYAILVAAQSGQSGLTDLAGWNTYARAAPFADCGKFTPPSGTAALCESTPPSRRPGTLFYLWKAESPARKLFGGPPSHSATLGRFGRAAILAQPFTYLKTVAHETERFVNPKAAPRRLSGAGPFRSDLSAPAIEALLTRIVSRLYSPITIHRDPGFGTFRDYQTHWRLSGVVPALLLALSFGGAIAGLGRPRRGAALFAALGAALIVFPAATLLYIDRYGIPAMAMLGAGAALGTAALAGRIGRLSRSARG
jgi:4-amino-4-deoxy-L-arabinose transferase-like glycosyltransferase